MLKRGHRHWRWWRFKEAKDSKVLSIMHDRNYSFRVPAFRSWIQTGLKVVADPLTRRNNYFETTNRLIYSPAQAIVDSANLGSRRVIESRKLNAAVAGYDRGKVERVRRPAEDCLDFKPLSLPVFIICGDSLGRPSLNIVDSKDAGNASYTCERCPTGMAKFRLRIFMGASA
jgi:hypothetical protein